MELVKIDQMNFNDTLESIRLKLQTNKNEIISTIKDCVLYIPHKYEIICNIINSIITSDIEFEEEIKKIIFESEDTNLSKLIYAKALGFIVELEDVDTIYQLFSDDIIDTTCQQLYINNLKDFSNINYITLYSIISILQNYSFDLSECFNELQNFTVDNIFEGILWMIGKIEDIYLINIILRLIEDVITYDSFLFYCSKMPKHFRDLLLPFFYERFINKKSFIENMSKIQEYIDDKTRIEFIKFCSPESCSRLFKYKEIHIECLSKDQFKLNEDKKVFYRDFCLLGSPSISHFLSYLEIYKNEMKMDEEEQKKFLEIFNEIFDSKLTFKKVILEKMRRFKFIK